MGDENGLRDLLLTLSPSGRDKFRTVLIRDDRDEIAQLLLRYGDVSGDRWADVIDTLTMHPDARRRLVLLLARSTPPVADDRDLRKALPHDASADRRCRLAPRGDARRRLGGTRRCRLVRRLAMAGQDVVGQGADQGALLADRNNRQAVPNSESSAGRWVAMSGDNGRAAAGGGAIYALGIFGAWVWFWQQADTFWGHALAVLQGLFWPAFMVYDVFRAIAR